jgi:response regulator RpfG family c-di-GMP phosphodiesterase
MLVFGKDEDSVRAGPFSPYPLVQGARLGTVTAQTGTVVVIEDDPHIADLVDLYLRRDGFRVLLARDGEQGLTIVNQEDSRGSSYSMSACRVTSMASTSAAGFVQRAPFPSCS